MKRIASFLVNWYRLCTYYWYDARMYFKYSLNLNYKQYESRYVALITLYAHSIEKGLTMPKIRYNFGEANVRALIQALTDYAPLYNKQLRLIQSAVGALNEYEHVHLEQGKSIPEDIKDGIHRIAELYDNKDVTEQPIVMKSEMYKHGDFEYVAHHRHSVRNFRGAVDNERLKKALELALTTPTACNRQPIHVHVIERGDNFDRILKLQNGNRGFGELADKLMIITADVSCYISINENHGAYVDGGIYTMNLLYALQYYGISACALNMYLMPERDRQLRSILHTNDVPVVMIAIGDCADEVKVAASERRDIDEVVSWL